MTTFKVGDKVKVVCKITKESGWSNLWATSLMDKFICNGQTYIVTRVVPHGVYLLNHGSLGWPHGSLVLADPVVNDGLTPVQRRCKKLWNNSNYVKNNPQLIY